MMKEMLVTSLAVLNEEEHSPRKVRQIYAPYKRARALGGGEWAPIQRPPIGNSLNK